MTATNVTQYLPEDLPENHPRRKLRDLTMDEFIEKWGSGTLRKSKKLGFNIQEAYLKERARFEFGEGFEIVFSSRVTYSDIKLVSCQGMTELGWHAERMIELRPFESDVFQCKQFDISYEDNTKKIGAGIIVWSTSASWIPKGMIVLSVLTEQVNGKYQPAINPF